MQFFDFIFVPTILFLVIVMPLWLIMHYRYKSKNSRGLTESDQAVLDDLLRTLDKLTDRMETLESILDARSPQWRRESSRREDKR
ncbi:envelope stress response membrane protein PspB [Reinekea marina]|uniref:Envelope stress response membrane protein PspB n=1 Tax=Reinekea marina TaxID=1310421 RepID=A0ABV7WQF2_9GAMM|nr:envelope stress response membrane protein PspB [Reinekea marina]MBU2864459.1 envelope stress response membrane protein PspB [Reinekea forsetii]MDN3647636.1 envelope stress response membrane protein PspB [Reinekea marina]